MNWTNRIENYLKLEHIIAPQKEQDRETVLNWIRRTSRLQSFFETMILFFFLNCINLLSIEKQEPLLALVFKKLQKLNKISFLKNFQPFGMPKRTFLKMSKQ